MIIVSSARIIRSLKEFILLDVHNRAVKNLDYSALYLQTVDEYDATIKPIINIKKYIFFESENFLNHYTLYLLNSFKYLSIIILLKYSISFKNRQYRLHILPKNFSAFFDIFLHFLYKYIVNIYLFLIFNVYI